MSTGIRVDHSILIFFALAFMWSWAFWLLSPLLKTASAGAATVLFFIGGFGPSLAAVAVVAHHSGRSGASMRLDCTLKPATLLVRADPAPQRRATG